MQSVNPNQIRWNQKYLSKGLEKRNADPSQWLCVHEQMLKNQPKGYALDIACGNGRNAFYLASLGFQVEAADISDVAIEWLQQQVKHKKGKEQAVEPRIMDFERDHLPTEKYQVIVCFNYLERTLFSQIKNALLPKGLLFFETIYRDSIETLGSSMNPAYVLDYNELLQAFSDLRILAYQEQILGTPEENNQRALARLVARKI